MSDLCPSHNGEINIIKIYAITTELFTLPVNCQKYPMRTWKLSTWWQKSTVLSIVVRTGYSCQREAVFAGIPVLDVMNIQFRMNKWSAVMKTEEYHLVLNNNISYLSDSNRRLCLFNLLKFSYKEHGDKDAFFWQWMSNLKTFAVPGSCCGIWSRNF